MVVTRFAEVWQIPNFPDYLITPNGHIWSTFSDKWMNPSHDKNGYAVVGLYKNKKRYYRKVHRLVLETFVGLCPNGMECCHINGDISRNHIYNLRWDTKSNNTKDSIKHGTYVDNRGEKSGMSKLKEVNVKSIILIYALGRMSQRQIGKLYNISQQQVSRIIKRIDWKHIWS